MRWPIVLALVAASGDAAADGTVRCVDAADGVERWRGARRAHAAPAAEAAAAPDREIWTTTDAIVHLAGDTGAPRTIVATGAFVDDLAFAGDVLVFTLDRDDGQVYGFGLPERRLRWVVRPRALVDGYEAGDGSRVELLGGRLLVHAPPALLAIDPATGGVAWTTRVRALEGRWGPLRALAVGARWVVAVDGLVAALDAETGRVRWTVDAGAGGATAPVADGASVCFDRSDEAAAPFAPDEAEVARALAITVEAGVVTDLRWVRRAEVDAGARRVPLFELPDADAGLALTAGDARRVVDVAPLLDRDGEVVVEVAGAWEAARLVAGDVDLIAWGP